MKKTLKIILVLIVLLFIGGYFTITNINSYQTAGELQVNGLQEQVTITRDERNVPYIHAKNMHDLMMAQGYVMAQDRLFQMQLTRMFAQGRISELAGEKAIALDTRMRTYGFYRNAKKHFQLMEAGQKSEWQAFADGINAFIEHGENIHVEFQAASISPDLWEVEHCLAVLYYMGWGGAANMSAEALSQMLLDKIGTEKFNSLLPLYTNPDEANAYLPDSAYTALASANLGEELMSLLDKSALKIQWGSNNWAVDGTKSTTGKPLLASDPHLDARILPGTMYACGLFTDDLRAIGVTIPGMPGLLIGRNQYIANGITNAYLDEQDLYIEQVDPNNSNNYLEGENSIPFRTIKEQLIIKDGEAEKGFRTEEITIRLSKRGPVVSKVIPGLSTNRVLTLRWAPYENMLPKVGLDHLLRAKSVEEARELLRYSTMACNNVVLVDVNGGLSWQTVGTIPKRKANTGRFAQLVTDTTDNWLGIIPYDSMPYQIGSERGWLGNANNNTLVNDFPYYVSNSFAPKYRYSRIKMLLNTKDKFSATDFWKFQRDTYNTLGAKYAKPFAEILSKQKETEAMGKLLADWNYQDDLESVGTSIFQAVYRHVARLTFQDELGDELATEYLKNWYFWQERFDYLMDKGNSPWFDDVTTSNQVEGFEDLLKKAGLLAKAELSKQMGENPAEWKWERIHHIKFVNPLVREGAMTGIVGGKEYPMAGSGETLYRAKYAFDKPNDVVFHSALRMVADMNDSEKVLAITSGGSVGRTFSTHLNDQLDDYMDGTNTYWWFSKSAIEAHTTATLTLNPQK